VFIQYTTSSSETIIYNSANRLYAVLLPQVQLIARCACTPVRRAVYGHLLLIHREVHICQWNYVWLPASDGPILVYTACSLHCFTGTVHTTVARQLLKPQTIMSLLENPLEIVLDSLHESQLERAVLREQRFGRSSVVHWKLVADGKLWVVEAWANRRLWVCIRFAW